MDRKAVKTKDPLVQKVLQRMAERSESGIKKFGVTMQDAEQSLEHWIANTQEELSDTILYLEKLKEEIRKKEILWSLKNLKKK
tara:strand:+ start:605 stop:853 length:249 start_codon:yes stop_codon:yes gene_type:complete